MYPAQPATLPYHTTASYLHNFCQVLRLHPVNAYAYTFVYMYMRARERISNLYFAPEVSMSNFCASFIWFALVSLFGLSKGLFIRKLRPLR